MHARDVAEAYAAAAVAEVPGAFNICADDVLDVRDLAHLVGTGRAIELPVPAVRAALATAHRAGLVAADPGWLDMGMNVPVMDNARADRELGWRPRYSAADALSESLEGMADGRGTGSVPMRARDSRRARLAVDGTSAGEGAGRDAGASPRIDTGSLGLYLSDHLTGAAAGAPASTGWPPTSWTRPSTPCSPRSPSRSVPSGASSTSSSTTSDCDAGATARPRPGSASMRAV
ncbi:hypothetical protein [Brachybacterium sp. GPGPB12]|uniref:hypothetical protein n=1 Tax=Brachybacterium sp. GPGPB12 TaxID=3023517 RepID=UPI0031344822